MPLPRYRKEARGRGFIQFKSILDSGMLAPKRRAASNACAMGNTLDLFIISFLSLNVSVKSFPCKFKSTLLAPHKKNNPF